MAVAKAACLNHISRESSDIRRLANFYKEIFGFEEIESPDFGEFKVIWLNLPGSFPMHLIERNPLTKLPEGPYSSTAAVADPSNLPRGHHICLTVSNFDSFVQSLKMKLWEFVRIKEFRLFRGPSPMEKSGRSSFLIQMVMDWRLPVGKLHD
ncbi:uncharacterized protein LOC108480980 isoform X1 [Gossypium arboreum]|uniref:uncharacterized protein LOC108480980 isoform X1 n=1 Tax=Gossypium arboreum TaxID=29729 RepID=UPI0022F1B206|nr:uncharacterized protein LOC108480980 isoform X1 [Gossypium arboreum]